MSLFRRKSKVKTVTCRKCGSIVDKESAIYSPITPYSSMRDWGRSDWYCQRCAKEEKREFYICPHCGIRVFEPATIQWTRYLPIKKKRKR